MSVEQDVYRIRHATYGEEVRESIADAIEGMNVKVEATEEARQDAIHAAEQAEEYRDETQQIVDDVVDDIYERVVEEVGSALDTYLTNSASGTIVEFLDGADNIPLKSLTVNITPIQSGSGDPSPTNVRPIGGWTGACIATHQGENLIGGADMATSMKRYVPSTTVDANNVATFFTTADRDDYIHFAQLPYKENTQYTFILTVSRTVIPSTSNIVYRLFYTDGSYENIGLPDDREANTKYTLVRTSVQNKTVAYLGKVGTSGYISIYCNESGVFEGVLTAADFVPYVGKTIAVTWQTEAGTVYGGTLTYSGGKWRLVVTHKQIVFDGSQNWLQSQDASSYYYVYVADMARGLRLDDPCVISDWLPQANSGNTPFFRHSSSSGVKNIFLVHMDLIDGSIVNAASLKSYLAQHPLTVVYAVDTDNAYDLTADEVKSLLGENHIWADCGNIAELTYRIDPSIHEAETQSKISDLTAKAFNAYPTETSSGAIASTTTGADDIPLKSLTVNITPIQSGSGDPSPTNVRSISGWTGVNVWVNQLNLFDGVYLTASVSSAGGRYIFRTDLAGRTVVLPIKGGLEYLVKKFDESNRMTICWSDHYPQNGDGLTLIFSGDYTTEKSISVPVGARYLIILVSTSAEQAEPRMVVKFGTETIAEFVPYVGNGAEISWQTEAGTVYGGTLDVINGVLTVDSWGHVFDGTESIDAYSNVTARWGIPSDYSGLPSGAGTQSYRIPYSSHYPTSASDPDPRVSMSNTGSALLFGYTITDGEYSQFADYLVEQYANGTPVTVVWRLLTEQTFALTPADVKSLLGTTNVWADTGDVEAVFRCDPTLYIDSKIQALTALMSEL